MPDMVRRVTVFALGGTIAMTPASTGGVTPALSAEDLIASVPGLAETGVTIGVNNFRRLPGACLGFDDLIALTKATHAAFAAATDGVVVTQGTDTIEETSYLLDLWHDDHRPVVVTGAMRNPAMAGADGPANLLAAIQVAASSQAERRGVLVVLGDQIHAASEVSKTHSTSGATFQSPNSGPVGHMVEGQPCFLGEPPHRLRISRPAKGFPRIGLVTVTLGDGGEVLDCIEGKVDGLVVAAMGVGHVPERLVSILDKLAAGMPVILASRTGAGAVLRDTYGFSGSERDLISRGLLPAGFLHPLKARLLLGALIAAGAGKLEIAQAVAVAAHYAEPQTWPWPAETSQGA